MGDVWEYCEIEVTFGLSITASCWIYRPDGEHEVRTVGKFGAMIAQLGLEGWEMVSYNSRSDFGKSQSRIASYVFKRRKEGVHVQEKP